MVGCSFDSVEKDFKYDPLNNVIEISSQIKENVVVIFTDGSALGKPGPIGAGAVVYLSSYQSSPILLKKV